MSLFRYYFSSMLKLQICKRDSDNEKSARPNMEQTNHWLQQSEVALLTKPFSSKNGNWNFTSESFIIDKSKGGIVNSNWQQLTFVQMEVRVISTRTN